MAINEPSINDLHEILVIPQLVETTGFLHRLFEVWIGLNGFLQKEDSLFFLSLYHVYISQIV